MEKKKYTSLEMEIIEFDTEDVIVTSGCGGIEDEELPRLNDNG